MCIRDSFKRVGEGDAGPNTGGMGAYTPLDWTPRGLIGDVVTSVCLLYTSRCV